MSKVESLILWLCNSLTLLLQGTPTVIQSDVNVPIFPTLNFLLGYINFFDIIRPIETF